MDSVVEVVVLLEVYSLGLVAYGLIVMMMAKY